MDRVQKPVLISSCLVGKPCRYNGKSSLVPELAELVEQGKAILVCPEQLGGLPTPREPAEIIATDTEIKVVTKNGEEVTRAFREGAEKTLQIALESDVTAAILKSKSPSCGCGQIYDGTFSSTLIKGSGLTATLLDKNGIQVITDEEYVAKLKI